MTTVTGGGRALVVGLRLAAARMRAEWSAVAMVFVLIAITALLFAAAPRAFNRMADQGLRYELAQAATAQRNLEFARFSHLTPPLAEAGSVDAPHPSVDPLVVMEAEAAALLADLPATVRDLVSEETYLVDTVRYLVREAPQPPSYLSLRYQSEIDPHIRVVQGRLPSGATEHVPVPGAFGDSDAGPAVSFPSAPSTEVARALLLEVALSKDTLDTLGVSVGDRLYLAPDTAAAQQGFGFAASLEYLAVDVVGSFEVLEPTAEYWLADTSLHRPTRVLESVDLRITYATALMSPEAIAPLTTLLMPLTQEWRFQVDPERVDAGRLDLLVADLRRLEASHPALPATIGAQSTTSLQTGLSDVVRGYLEVRQASEAALAVAAIGPGAAAAGAITLSATLLARRRRGSIALVRDRGASPAQLFIGHSAEAVVVATAASTLGLWLANLGVPARPSPASLAAALLVAVGSAVVLTVTAVRLARRGPSPGREETVVLGLQPRRLVLEAVVVVLAVAGVLAIRDRGLLATGAGGDAILSPYLAAVPLLLGLAVGLVVLRLYPFPVRGLAWLAALGRGLVPVLALRRAGRQSAWANVPVLVLLVAVAIGSFSSITLATVQRGQEEAAWQEIGADYRITSGDALPTSVTDAPPAVTAVARAFSSQVPFTGGNVQRRPVVLHAIEADAYARLLDDTPADLRLPASIRQPVLGDAPGSAEEPMPAIVSESLADLGGLSEGDLVQLSFAGRRVAFEIVDIRQRFPGLGLRTIFVVAGLEAARAAAPDRVLSPTTLYARGTDVEGAFRDLVAAEAPGARLDSREARLAQLREAPLVGAVSIGFLAAVAVAVAYAALALVTALVLSAASRSREAAMLRTMGLGRRQHLALAVIEYLPPLVVTVVAGGALGIAIATLLQPGLELERFVSAAGSVRTRIDALSLALVGVLPAAILGAAVLTATAVARHVSVTRTLRAMEE